MHAGDYRILAATATFRLLSFSVLEVVYRLELLFLTVFLSELQERASDFPDRMRWPEPLEFDVRLNIERFADPPQK